jgi:hypothetical protein
MVQNQVSMEGVAKGDLLFCKLLLVQSQSDVQGRCRVATISCSSCAKTQDAYDKLNCIDCEESSCSGACLQLLILG